MTAVDFIWQAVIILAFGGAGLAVCSDRASGESSVSFQSLLARTPHLYFAFPLLVALPTMNLYVATHLAVQWEMPPWLQLHWASLSWGIVSSVLAYVFGFCAIAAFVTGQRGARFLIAFAIVVLAVIQIYAAWNSRPRLPPLGKPTVSGDGVILQTTPYTCVPAAGANIAAILGIHATEKELVDLFHTTRDGTFPAQVLYGFEKLGITGSKAPDDCGIEAVRPPAMLFVVGDTHAVVYIGMRHGRAEIWNPSEGKLFLPEWRLGQLWDGHALEFRRKG